MGLVLAAACTTDPEDTIATGGEGPFFTRTGGSFDKLTFTSVDGAGMIEGEAALPAELKAKGVEFTSEPHVPRQGIKICFLRGPQGISIELLERILKDALYGTPVGRRERDNSSAFPPSLSWTRRRARLPSVRRLG